MDKEEYRHVRSDVRSFIYGHGRISSGEVCEHFHQYDETQILEMLSDLDGFGDISASVREGIEYYD